MGAPKYTQSDIDTAVELREQGESLPRIAAELGMSVGAVYYHCLKLGADSPKNIFAGGKQMPSPPVMQRGDHEVRRFTPEEDGVILSMRKDGVRIQDIARCLNRKSNSVHTRLYTLARKQERAETV